MAVKCVLKEAHRRNFHALKQSEGESITHYMARLQSQAQLYARCGEETSYVNDMVACQLIAGMRNAEHQAKLLAEATTPRSLQEKFDRLVSMETTELSTNHLNRTYTVPLNAHATKPGYQKGKVIGTPSTTIKPPC